MSHHPLVPLGALARAQDSFGVTPNAPTNEWPYNLLSQKAVRYAGGRIVRDGDDPQHDYDPAELGRCHRIAAEAVAHFARLPVRSPELADLEPFCLPANRGDAPAALTPEGVRAAFRGTLHPWAVVRVQPALEYGPGSLGGSGSAALVYGEENVRSHHAVWQETAAWFGQHPDLTGTAWFVVADGQGFFACQAIRLIVGLTRAGSLTGVAAVCRDPVVSFDIPAGQAKATFHKLNLDGVKQWVHPTTGRAVVPVVLRAYEPAEIAAWRERVVAEVDARPAGRRAALWRAGFDPLVPRRTLTVPPVWEAIQRCLACGMFQSNRTAAAYPFHHGSLAVGEIGAKLGFYLFPGERVAQTADWLAAHDADWFRSRYEDLRATDYAGAMSAADRRAAVDAYEAVREFYRQAKGRFAVLAEIPTRPADPAAKRPPARKKAVTPVSPAEPPPGGCEIAPAMLAPLAACMNPYGAGRGQWANNDISTRTVRYACGNIGLAGKAFAHDHDPAEVERCRALAAEAAGRLAAIRPAEDEGGPYLAFFSTANRGEPVPERFAEAFVRERLFSGATQPEIGLRVEPLTPQAVSPDDGSAAAAFVDWFLAHPGLHGHAFVSIGISDDDGGPCHPRLALAFTDRGSVVGVCGYVVWA